VVFSTSDVYKNQEIVYYALLEFLMLICVLLVVLIVKIIINIIRELR